MKKNTIIAIGISVTAVMAVGVVGLIPNQNNETTSHITAPENNVIANEVDYGTNIFGVDIISLDILADENQWQQMIDTGEDDEYMKVDVVVNGTTFNDVGIKTKGNLSHNLVSESDSDRYSFRLKFDEFVEDQTCFGLDTFVINNMIGDTTYMKEYISYDIMKEAGVEAPYFGFTDVKLNGENIGFYLAVERYNDSYEERISGNTDSMLYSVKAAATEEDTGGMLKYNGDNYQNYPSIFENAVGKSEESDYNKVIAAMKALSEGRDIESYWNVDEILRYFAAHNIVVNLDSYSSGKVQNYFLREVDGRVSMLPWDYHFAFGGLETEDTSSIVNFPIDTPVVDAEMSDRPILDKLFSNEEYLKTYHNYLQEIIDNYFADGKFEAKINELNNLIEPFVQADPSKFYSYDDYKKSVSALIDIGNLRAQSIQGQLDGTIPSTREGQISNPEALIVGGNLADLNGENLRSLVSPSENQDSENDETKENQDLENDKIK